jgi:hypothetical protein
MDLQLWVRMILGYKVQRLVTPMLLKPDTFRIPVGAEVTAAEAVAVEIVFLAKIIGASGAFMTGKATL